MNWKCLLGHSWVVHDEPFMGRRNRSRIDESGNYVVEYGPDELIQRGDNTGAPIYRDCTRCAKRSIHIFGRWT